MIARLFASLIAVSSLGFAQAPLTVTAVVNAASLTSGPLAPGTLAVLTGSGLSDTNETASASGAQSLPTKLGGVQVFLYGVALPLLSVSPTQVEFQLPYRLNGISSGVLYLQREDADGHTVVSSGTSLSIEPAAPGIYAFGGPEPRAGLILHAQASGNVPAGAPVTESNPAHAGETVIVWATGLGNVETLAVQAGTSWGGQDASVMDEVDAEVNGRSVPVLSAVLPQGGLGVYEIRVQLPDDMASDSKAQLSLTEGGHASNAVLFSVQGSNH